MLLQQAAVNIRLNMFFSFLFSGMKYHKVALVLEYKESKGVISANKRGSSSQSV